jgi:hypothetical protein
MVTFLNDVMAAWVRLPRFAQKVRREFALQTGQKPCFVWNIPELTEDH